MTWNLLLHPKANYRAEKANVKVEGNMSGNWALPKTTGI